MLKPSKIGHRGAMAYIAENTLASFQKAIHLGVDGVELDVHKCKSGELVVFHDFTLDRITNGSGEISSFTLPELKKLKVLKEHSIPTLVEVLKVIKTPCTFNIELKGINTAKGTVAIIEDFVKNNGASYNQFIVSSFQKSELLAVYKSNLKIPLGVLTKANVTEAIAFAKTIKAKAIHPNFSLLSKNNVKQAQMEGFKINTWTVNDTSDIERMVSYNVDAIMSDFPDRLQW